MSVDQGSSTNLVVIYVQLLEEGTPVWCPVFAAHMSGPTYRLIEVAGSTGEADTLQYPIGSVVKCELRELRTADELEKVFVAVEAVP